jgi:hypothetical protein
MTAVPKINLGKVRTEQHPPPSHARDDLDSAHNRKTSGSQDQDDDRDGEQEAAFNATLSPGECHGGEPMLSGTPADENEEEGQESFRDYSAAPTPHTARLDASELLGCNVFEITDVPTLQSKLIEAQKMFMALEVRYDKALEQRERHINFLLRALNQQQQLLNSMKHPTHTPRVQTPTSSSREFHQTGPIPTISTTPTPPPPHAQQASHASGGVGGRSGSVGMSSSRQPSVNPSSSTGSARYVNPTTGSSSSLPSYHDTTASRVRQQANQSALSDRRESVSARYPRSHFSTTPRAVAQPTWRSVAEGMEKSRSGTPRKTGLTPTAATSTTPAGNTVNTKRWGGSSHAQTPRY